MIDKRENTYITSELKEDLKKKKENFVGARSSTLSSVAVKEILEMIKKKYDLKDLGESVTVLAFLFQGGGTARSCDGNMVVTVFDKDVKLGDIRKILKEAKCNRAERKLARSLANDIYEISATLEIDGNLYKKIQRSNLEREFTSDERAWLSDFQSDNVDCPIKLRNLIVETFQKKK
nr:hypothetical protein [Nitzschia ovalis]